MTEVQNGTFDGGCYVTYEAIRLWCNNFGAKFGAMALLYLVGSASAPFVGSLIWDVGGYDLVLSLLIELCFVALCLYLAALRLSRQTGH